MDKVEIDKKRDSAWLFGDDESVGEKPGGKLDLVGGDLGMDDEFAGFIDNQFEKMENGQLMFQLQKTFHGDKRFVLNDR
jgi:hypothetical protein